MTTFLLSLGEKPELKKAVLIPTNDDCVIVLSQQKKVLEKNFIVPLQEWDIINRAFDKRIILSIAEKLGLPIPKPIYPVNKCYMLEKIEKLEYPVVVKPVMGKRYYFYAETKMHMSANKEEAAIIIT